MNVFFLTLLFITAAPYADADTIFNEKTSFNTAKAVKLGRGGGISGWTNATIVTATRAVDADKTCMAHCAACNTKTGQCSKCEDGYWMEGGSCNLCSDFLENCAVCDASGSTCTKCFDGYKLTGGSCTGGSCEDGYWWDDWELACFACPADCKTCSDDATCESCFDGYYHDMDRCAPCSQNCKQCNYNGCTQCESGYELNNGKCSQITCEIANCSSCSEDGKSCLKCKSGWEWLARLTDLPDDCYPIDNLCMDWDSVSGKKCISCVSNYCPDSTTGLCVASNLNRQETTDLCTLQYYCDGSSKCISCNDPTNYVLKEGNCVKKPEHCTGTYTQQTDGSYKCSQCETGYTGAECDECVEGYTNNGEGQCKQCPDGCKTCERDADNVYQCTACQSGYVAVCHVKTETSSCINNQTDIEEMQNNSAGSSDLQFGFCS